MNCNKSSSSETQSVHWKPSVLSFLVIVAEHSSPYPPSCLLWLKMSLFIQGSHFGHCGPACLLHFAVTVGWTSTLQWTRVLVSSPLITTQFLLIQDIEVVPGWGNSGMWLIYFFVAVPLKTRSMQLQWRRADWFVWFSSLVLNQAWEVLSC